MTLQRPGNLGFNYAYPRLDVDHPNHGRRDPGQCIGSS